MTAFPITVFADFSCPYSYVTESSLRRVAGVEIELRYRAFELVPEPMPLEEPETGGEAWGALVAMAEVEQIPLATVAFRPRSAKAHEAARFAAERGRAAEMRELIYAAYWSEGRDIGRIDVLMELAAGIGLEPEELKIALDIDRYAADVANDREVAHRLRIPGTPTIFLGSGHSARVITGAHDSKQLRAVVEEAISSRIHRT